MLLGYQNRPTCALSITYGVMTGGLRRLRARTEGPSIGKDVP